MITEKGSDVLEIIKNNSECLIDYYCPMSGFINIHEEEITQELKEEMVQLLEKINQLSGTQWYISYYAGDELNDPMWCMGEIE